MNTKTNKEMNTNTNTGKLTVLSSFFFSLIKTIIYALYVCAAVLAVLEMIKPGVMDRLF